MDKCCYEKGMRRLKDKKELTRGEDVYNFVVSFRNGMRIIARGVGVIFGFHNIFSCSYNCGKGWFQPYDETAHSIIPITNTLL